jgi:hypothetical protein
VARSNFPTWAFSINTRDRLVLVKGTVQRLLRQKLIPLGAGRGQGGAATVTPGRVLLANTLDSGVANSQGVFTEQGQHGADPGGT